MPRILTMMAGLFRKGGAGSYALGSKAYRQPMQIYRGRGNGSFENVTARSGDPMHIRISGRGSACADFDGDGRLDLAVGAVVGGVRILKNVSTAGHAIEILPVPPGGNPEPSKTKTTIGTKVAVTFAGRREVREFIVTPSFASGSWVPLHFGLGAATVVDSIEVAAPGSDRLTVLYRNVPADALYALDPFVSDGLERIRSFREAREPRPDQPRSSRPRKTLVR